MNTNRIGSCLATLLLVTSMICAAACNQETTPQGKTIVLGLDGLDPGAIDLLMSEGKMPNFAKLRQEGAYGRLISSKPILSPIIWTTIATGKPPHEHMIGHFVTTNEATGEQLPVTSQMREVKAIWNILTENDREVNVVGWWATWPAEQIDGAIVSDHTCYHFLFEDGQTGAEDTTGLMYPESLTKELEPLIRRPGDLTSDELAPFVTVSPEELDQPFEFSDDLGHFRWALATAKSYTAIGHHLWKKNQPDLLMVYVEGVDSSSHLFGHLFRHENLAGELAEQHKRFGQTVEQMYLYADAIVGEYLEAMDDDTTLVVLSDHGFQLGELHDDPSKTRSMRRVSEQYHNIEGILYMYGRGITPHARIDRPVLVDIAPTLMTLTGVAPPFDMKGRILTEALNFEPTPRTVATFESGEKRSATAANASAPVDPAILEHLKALGYVDTESPTGDRNLAALHFEAGRFEEAIKIYRTLVAADPGDGALRTSLAGTLASLGDYDAALTELNEAEKLHPLNPEIYHNRAAILERQGKPKEAVEQYKKATRYAPDYAPSRQALQRLIGTADVHGPANDAQRLAFAIAQQASAAARRGDYAAAMEKLDEAVTIAPRYPLVHQYRSNVQFLSGDPAGAIESLQKASELEPDNALFRLNLERLRAQVGAAAPADDPATPLESGAASPEKPAEPSTAPPGDEAATDEEPATE